MQRLIQYCQSVVQLYKSYPLVLVFCIDKVSPSTLITKFKPVDVKPWMHSIVCCDFWAKSCYLVSQSTLLSCGPTFSHADQPSMTIVSQDNALCIFDSEAFTNEAAKNLQ